MLLGAFLACTRLILHDCSCKNPEEKEEKKRKNFFFPSFFSSFFHVKKKQKRGIPRKSCMPDL